MIYISTYSFLENRNAVDFCAFILYPIILLSSFSVCRLLKVFYVDNHIIHNKDSFLSFLQICMAFRVFLFFYFLILLYKHIQFCAELEGESRQPCLISRLNGKAFGHDGLGELPSVPGCWETVWRGTGLVTCFFCPPRLPSLLSVVHMDWLLNTEPASHIWNFSLFAVCC